MHRDVKDILSGLLFVAFGLAFAVIASTYEIGSTLQMGPGYFPLALGGLLVLFGGLIVAKGILARDGEAIRTIPWRALALILGAVVFFGVTVRGLGLVPSVFVTVLMSTFASRRTSAIVAVLISVGLTILCILVFVVALRLRLPLLGPWIPV